MNNFRFTLDINKPDYKNREDIIKNMTLTEYYSINSNMICDDLITTLKLIVNFTYFLSLGKKFCP